jgi:predicted XRE-type DNA-binding protein
MMLSEQSATFGIMLRARGDELAEEHYLKAELVLRLDKAIKSLGLTQRVAARRFGTTQPELSKILGGKPLCVHFTGTRFSACTHGRACAGHPDEEMMGRAR